MPYRQLAARIIAFVTIGCVLAGMVGTASAHVGPKKSDPAGGSTVEKALMDIEPVFTEEVNPSFVTVTAAVAAVVVFSVTRRRGRGSIP